MSEGSFFNYLILSWFLLAFVIFISLFFFAAPYGRHTRNDWGPALGGKGGWLAMEAVAPLIFVILFFLGSNPITVTPIFFLIMQGGSFINIVTVTVTAILGGVSVAAGIRGYTISQMNPVQRVMAIIGGFLLIWPSLTVSLVGFTISLTSIISQPDWFRRYIKFKV